MTTTPHISNRQKVMRFESIKTVPSKVYSVCSETTQKVSDAFKNTAWQLERLKGEFVSTVRNFELTSTKGFQAVLVGGAGYFILSAKAIFGSLIPKTIPAFFGANALLSLSGALLYYAYSMRDYENRNSLSQMREEAKKLDIESIIKKHTWDRVFSSKILSKEALTQKCLAHMNNLSTDELFEFYKGASEALSLAKATYETCDYEIPFPRDLELRFGKEFEGISEYPEMSRETVDKLLNISLMQKQRAVLREKANEELQISEKSFLDDSESQIALMEQKTNRAQVLFAKAKISPLDRVEREELFSILKSMNPTLGKHLSLRIEHHFENLVNLERELNLAINSYKQATSFSSLN